MILIKPPDDLCFLVCDSLMIPLVIKITLKFRRVEIPDSTFTRIDEASI